MIQGDMRSFGPSGRDDLWMKRVPEAKPIGARFQSIRARIIRQQQITCVVVHDESNTLGDAPIRAKATRGTISTNTNNLLPQ